MIITAAKEDKKFEPLNINIKVETQKELKMLGRFMSSDQTVPEAIEQLYGDSELTKFTAELMKSIHYALCTRV